MSSAKPLCAHPAARAARSHGSAASARCAACTTRRMRACASACALALGVSTDVLQNGLRSFPGLAHRMEQVGRRGNVLFVNDSKGTNADAAAHALSSFCRYLLDRRRQAEARRHRRPERISSRASARPI